MKDCILKSFVFASAVSLLALAGCTTVVTDVNAELNAMRTEEVNLGTPVQLNENYVEVAYNPEKAPGYVSPEEEISETEPAIENEENDNNSKGDKNGKNNSDKDTDKKDGKKGDKENSDGEDKENTDKEDSENPDGEDTDNPDGEDTENPDGEDTENPDGEIEKPDGELADKTGVTDADGNENPDANASVGSEEFDPEFYAATYPDVVAVFGNSPEALLKHYQDYGKAEGRSCNAEEYALLNEAATPTE